MSKEFERAMREMGRLLLQDIPPRNAGETETAYLERLSEVVNSVHTWSHRDSPLEYYSRPRTSKARGGFYEAEDDFEDE
jgi:hypothetical protein